MPLPAHLFASDSGALYDTRQPDWSARPPLRAVYHRHVRDIRTAADVKACLRAGRWAWPGGYPLYFVARDGEALSFDSVRENLASVLTDTSAGRGDWAVVAVETNFEDSDLTCCHSGARIPSAYGED